MKKVSIKFLDELSQLKSIQKIRKIIQILRDPIDGCPWDLKQNYRTLAPYSIEEAYELVNAIESNNIVEIKNNLLKYKPYAISMPYSSVGFYSRKFPNYYIHCWTNNMIKDKDKDKIRDLCEIDNVKIILTDFKENFLK